MSQAQIAVKPRAFGETQRPAVPKVCPEGITITDNAIIPLKERVVDRFYDPLRRVFRVFRGGA